MAPAPCGENINQPHLGRHNPTVGRSVGVAAFEEVKCNYRLGVLTNKIRERRSLVRIVYYHYLAYLFRIASTAAAAIAITATPTAAYVTSVGKPVV